jgi:hypothetical protein
MHYGERYFSKAKGKPTLVPKMKGEKVGQRKSLSQTDCLKVNELYGCLDDFKMVSIAIFISFFLSRISFSCFQLGQKVLHALSSAGNLSGRCTIMFI